MNIKKAWVKFWEKGVFFSWTGTWPGEDRLDNQKPIEKKNSAIWEWLNKRR